MIGAKKIFNMAEDNELSDQSNLKVALLRCIEPSPCIIFNNNNNNNN